MRLGRTGRWWRIAAAALLAVSGAWAQSSGTPRPTGETSSPAPSARSFSPPRGALIAPGKTPDLTFLYTGYVIGYLEPCG